MTLLHALRTSSLMCLELVLSMTNQVYMRHASPFGNSSPLEYSPMKRTHMVNRLPLFASKMEDMKSSTRVALETVSPGLA